MISPGVAFDLGPTPRTRDIRTRELSGSRGRCEETVVPSEKCLASRIRRLPRRLTSAGRVSPSRPVEVSWCLISSD